MVLTFQKLLVDEDYRVEKTISAAPLAEANFLVDEDDRVERTVAEAPYAAHLTEADFLMDEDDRIRMKETVSEAPHVAKDFLLTRTTEWRRLIRSTACCSPYRG
jgi:hypothetical protein